MEEHELLSKLNAGNFKAFEEILLKYEKKIFNYTYRLTSNTADAEDLVQETFLRLYDKRNTLAPEKGAKNWLYKVATNAAYDIFRKRKRAGEVFLEENDELETKPGDSPYYHIERIKDIESALACLRPEYRSALLLFYKEGFSYEEIAVLLDAPLNTVKTYIRRGKENLKKSLADYKE